MTGADTEFFWFKSVSFQYSCDEEYLEEYKKGKIFEIFCQLYSHETDLIQLFREGDKKNFSKRAGII